MMVSVELLLNVALLIALAFLVATWIGRAKSNNSRGWWIAKVLDEATLTAIEIGLLTVHCLSGENYGFNLFLSLLWLFNVVLDAFARSDD